MRKLVDAPRKKKQWTEKEEAYLQDKWGTVSIKGLSKALGRSENAIIVRAQRLGCGAHLAGDTRISLNQLMLASPCASGRRHISVLLRSHRYQILRTKNRKER